jgi:hypothetical protein
MGGEAPNAGSTAAIPTTRFRASRGQLVGAGLGVAFSKLAYDVASQKFGPQPDDDLVFLWGGFCGELVGRVIELRRQGRTAEIGQFWSLHLAIVPVFILMTVAALVGDRFFGSIGRYVGMIGVPSLAALIDQLWRVARGRTRHGEPAEQYFDTIREGK